mgnify:FL=1
MKHIISILSIALLTSFHLVAQSNATKKADKHFNKFEFVDATEAYLKVVNKGKADAYVYGQLAESYYNVFNTVEAEKWFAKASEFSSDSEMIYKYAEMLKANGNYEASNTQLAKFAALSPEDHRAIAFTANPKYLSKILNKENKFNLQNLPLNTNVSDFGGTLQDGKLYITTARNSSRKAYGWNDEPFLDIYTATVTNEGSFEMPTRIAGAINTKYHEGTVSFSPDGNTLYFSRESFYENVYEKDPETNYKVSVLNLYKSTKKGGEWSEPKALSLNNDQYSVKNPSVSADGNTLYFASDKPGGYGDFDIYSAPIRKNGNVSKATNMGQIINTEGQEMFPHISETNTLYFSSNGHLGLGGLDVFFAELVDGNPGPVRNIGIPINSNSDDFAFNINEETGEGFVSSNREGGKGSDDIYALENLQPICDVFLTVTVKDSTTGLIIEGASVSIQDAEGLVFGTKTSNAEGIVEYSIGCNEDTVLIGSKVEYGSGTTAVAGTGDVEVSADVLLTPINALIVGNSVSLNPIYFDFDKSNITAQAAFELDKLVQLMTKYEALIISAESHTDSRGTDSYNLSLSDRRAKSTAQYVISKGIDASRISGSGKGETTPNVDCGGNCTEDEHQLNRRSEFVIVDGNPNNE